MTMLQKAVITSIIVGAVATPLAIQHRAQARLRDENQILRQQLEQQDQLALENQRLAALIAQTANSNSQLLPSDQLGELLRLRSEVGRLRTEARERAQEQAARRTGDRANPDNPLRKQLEQMPDKYIPELQGLDESKWAEDAEKGKLDTEDGVRQALGSLRRAAKIRFASRLSEALNNYVKANAGLLPNDLSELKAFFNYGPRDRPVDDSVLQRYQLVHSGKVSDFGAGETLIQEKGAVDDQYDTLFDIGVSGYVMRGVGKWRHLTSTNFSSSAGISSR